MVVEETVNLSQEEIRYQLSLFKIRERSRDYIEWGSGLFNSLINMHALGIGGNLLVEKGERPDFRISFPALQNAIRFEVTMAASGAYQAARRLSLQDEAITHLEPSLYSEDPSQASDKREIGIGRNWQRLRGRPWGGSQAESQWIEFIEQAVQKKIPKFYDYGFDQLMIFDDSPVSDYINAYMAVRMFRRRAHSEAPFAINIWTGQCFVFDVFGACRFYAADKIHLTEAYFPYIRMDALEIPGGDVLTSSKSDFRYSLQEWMDWDLQ